VRGELGDALADLLAKRQRGELAFDRLVIETTGLADPAPVVQTFFWDERLREAFLLDAVITLIDVCHASAQLDREAVATSQVAFADWLVLTKTDLASADALPERLRSINARAEIVDVADIAALWPRLLDTGAFSLNERGLPSQIWSRKSTPANIGIQRGKTRQSWDDAIGSILLECPGDVDLAAISAFVDQLIEKHANDLLRYKGILAIDGEERRLIFQGVHRIAGFDYGRPWAEDEVRESRIVLIGRQLPTEQLIRDFHATRVNGR